MLMNSRRRFNPFNVPEIQVDSELNERTRAFFEKTVRRDLLVKQKNPRVDLKSKHKRVLEFSTAFTLVTLIFAVQLARNFSLAPAEVGNVDIKIEVTDIPKTEQVKLPPPPPKPQVPVPTEDENIPEDLTIASTELDLTTIPPPPPPREDDGPPIFFAYDEPPEIVGGIKALEKHLRYPQLARVAGVEGIVFVHVLVGKNGQVQKMQVIKAKPAKMGFEEAAMQALGKVKWKPAKQRDRSIRCWISIPVRFQLVNS